MAKIPARTYPTLGLFLLLHLECPTFEAPECEEHLEYGRRVTEKKLENGYAKVHIEGGAHQTRKEHVCSALSKGIALVENDVLVAYPDNLDSYYYPVINNLKVPRKRTYMCGEGPRLNWNERVGANAPMDR